MLVPLQASFLVVHGSFAITIEWLLCDHFFQKPCTYVYSWRPFFPCMCTMQLLAAVIEAGTAEDVDRELPDGYHHRIIGLRRCQ